MPIPIDVRKKPLDVKIHVSTGAGMDIIWSDTHASHYDFAYLRDVCPCALCNDEREKRSRVVGSGSGGAVLPMFKPKVTAKAARPVGHYAIQIDFSDGHTTGIFSFEHLREICPCPACQLEFQS
jgi:DUF971 family protein